MFCSKCGSQNDDAAKFCKKCGEGLSKENVVNEVMVSVDNKKQEKKKSKKWKYILGGIVAFIVMIMIVANWNGSTDYVATVGNHKPLLESQGISLTYANVLNKYLDSPKWETRKSGDVGYVDISGTIKGSTKKLGVKIKVSPNPNDPKKVVISPEAITINGNTPSTKAAAEQILLYMFLASKKGEADVAYYFD